MDNRKLVELLYGGDYKTIPQIEQAYPPRVLPEGAKVTRFAPSPTGFVHFGSLLPTRVSERLAHQSGGVFYLRIEDTDSKRRVEGAEEDLIRTYSYFQIQFDEGTDAGEYGPYHQSERADIYRAYAVKLLLEGRAYPCFATAEQLDGIRAQQEAAGEDPGYYGRWAVWRDADYAQVEAQVKAGAPFVIRFRSEGDPARKFKFTDLVKGALELPENHMDHVLLKSDGIPTYHFAHAVDDTLMGTTHVVRGEEWLPSLPFHLELFRALGFKAPKYLHIAQLLTREADGSKRKLSKRDGSASVSMYREKGYAPACITEYVMTLLNSNYEEWRAANPEKPFTDFPFSIKKMSASGALFDPDKLYDVCKNTVSRMTAAEVYDGLAGWAREYDADLYACLAADRGYAERILNIGRGGKKPRKDIGIWSEAKAYMGFFYDALFTPDYTGLQAYDRADTRAALERYAGMYDEGDDQQQWFDRVRALAQELGYAPDVKLYRQNPDGYRGHVGDISGMLRIAVTGRESSPDLFEVMRILGRGAVLGRLRHALDALAQR